MFFSSSSDASIRDAARDSKQAPVAVLARLLLGPLEAEHPGTRHTLLAVCPNSKAVTRAALRAAEAANTPLLYAATLNQVDRDGGYTGWTPAALAAFVKTETDRSNVDVPVFLGLDHGGPWAKDAHTGQNLAGAATMREVKRSIGACVKAGYDLLHLDPGAGPNRSNDDRLPISTLVDRTIELLRHAEDVRRAVDRDPIAYEVGTDDSRGGLDSEERLRRFLTALRETLGPHDLPLPTFVVGDLGTQLDSDRFPTERARAFVTAAQEIVDALVKGHYTDGVATPESYPLAGVGGANVGPGLSSVEADALRNLVALEDRLGKQSGVMNALRTAVIESGRWTKWLRPEEQGRSFRQLSDERQRWLVNTGGRYVWAQPSVKEARAHLYDNVAPYRDPEAYVGWRLETAILRYMHTFNLIGLADRIDDVLPNLSG